MHRKQRLASYGLIHDNERILLCRLGPETTAPGHWTLPGGGLEFGEHPEETLVREVAEETGLTVKPADLVEIWSTTSQFANNEWHVLHFIYRAEILGGQLANEIDGTTDLCGWFTPEEVARLALVPLAQKIISLA